jgi:[ribosomal protein S5]-alanine N-acetyltransferase
MPWSDPAQPTVETERLVLRPFQTSDAARVRELAGERAIADTTATIPHPYPEGAAEAWIASHDPDWQAGRGLALAITLRDGEFVGAIGLRIDLANDSGELGYWIGKPHWNRGFASEAALAVLDYAFTTIGLNRVAAVHLVRNPASGRVMEKIGMTQEGVLREAVKKWDIYEDVAQRAVLRREWETQKQRSTTVRQAEPR